MKDIEFEEESEKHLVTMKNSETRTIINPPRPWTPEHFITGSDFDVDKEKQEIQSTLNN